MHAEHAGLLAVAGALSQAHSCAFHLRQLHLSHNCRSHERHGRNGSPHATATSQNPQPAIISPDGTAARLNMLPEANNAASMHSKWMRIASDGDAEIAVPVLPAATRMMHESDACDAAMHAHNCLDMLEALIAMAPSLTASKLPRLQVCG
jgi:hypothetical protein